MPGNRVAAEKIIINYVEKLLPGSSNPELYKDAFKTMDDEQFENFINGLDTGAIKLALIAPIMNEHALSVERNLTVAKELGHEFFERIWMESKEGSAPYLSPIPYLVIDLPLRRQAQLLVTKISIPEHNRSVDNLTGQPTGDSKGSKISYPEVQILAALNLDKTLTELIKYRGGDTQGFNAMNESIAKSGGVSQDAIAALGTRVKSSDALRTYLVAMHLQPSGL
jgi:hypothetical protein